MANELFATSLKKCKLVCVGLHTSDITEGSLTEVFSSLENEGESY